GRTDVGRRPRLLQEPQPPRRRFAAAHDQRGPVLEVEKSREIIHRDASSPRHAGPTENVRGALALGDAGASCPSNPAGPLGGPGQTKKPAATIAGARLPPL